MLLADDLEKTVLEPSPPAKDQMEEVYDFDLMERGGPSPAGGWTGRAWPWWPPPSGSWPIRRPSAPATAWRTSRCSSSPWGTATTPLATAKECYERQKKLTPREQWDSLPARYALCELVNLHDASLEFEPIHRVAFGVEPERVVEELLSAPPRRIPGRGRPCAPLLPCRGRARSLCPARRPSWRWAPSSPSWTPLREGARGSIDYIHGADVARDLAARPGNIAFLLPAMGKEQLFPTVIRDGVLPRKTFSMGRPTTSALPGGAQDPIRGDPMPVLETRAYAKLNLSLDVLDRRSDGYHEMRMVMQTVTLSDALRLETGTGKPLSMRSSLGFLPADERNLAAAAALRLCAETGADCGGLSIELDKSIPVCAGLAGAAPTPLPSCGGSTACWGWASPPERLEAIGARVGSDVPYCVRGGTAPGRGGGRCSPLCPPCPTAMWCCASPPSRCPRRSSSPGWTAAASAAARTPPVCWPPWRRGSGWSGPAHV